MPIHFFQLILNTKTMWFDNIPLACTRQAVFFQIKERVMYLFIILTKLEQRLRSINCMHSTGFFGNKNRRSKTLETILIPYKHFSFYAEFQLQTSKKNYFSLSFSICKMMTFCELVRHNLKLLLKADIFHSHWRKSCRSCYLLNILIANFFYYLTKVDSKYNHIRLVLSDSLTRTNTYLLQC